VRGCIPAVLSDPVSFPYERLLDYRALTLKLPEQWAPRALELLRAVNKSAVAALRRGLLAAAPAFQYRGGCAFEMLLVELAARKHAFFGPSTRPATPNSPTDFWLPSGAFRLHNASKVGPSWGAAAEEH